MTNLTGAIPYITVLALTGVDRNLWGESGRQARAGRDMCQCVSRLEPRVPIHPVGPNPPRLTVVTSRFNGSKCYSWRRIYVIANKGKQNKYETELIRLPADFHYWRVGYTGIQR